MDDVALELFEMGQQTRTQGQEIGRYIPLKEIECFLLNTTKILFFEYHLKELDQHQLSSQMNDNRIVLNALMHFFNPNPKEVSSIDDLINDFFKQLPSLRQALILDATAILEGDPAAQDIHEVIVCYPGMFAITVYRISNLFYKCKQRFFARILAEMSHQRTGIDIHPGATIGKSFFIDHGTGIVIGETSVIGDNVKIYQGVTLGALSVKKNLQDKKRHPTIEDSSTIYANATILGGDTVVGHHSIVGGNVWLTSSIPAHSIVNNQAKIKLQSPKAP